jgi:glycyl-tRNA synthetase beta chain
MPKKRMDKAPKAESLLVELLTEELPPKALFQLSKAFVNHIHTELLERGLIDESLIDDDTTPTAFATPRRIAVLIPGVREYSPDTLREVQGPPVGAPEQAVNGFAKKNSVAVDALEKRKTPKGEVFVARVKSGGIALDSVLAGMVEASLKALPIPKAMRWGSGGAQFVRPVHGLVMMHGSKLIAGAVLGVASSNRTVGHRFLSSKPVAPRHANDYERALGEQGKVEVDFEKRRQKIVAAILKIAGKSTEPVIGDELLDEITGLVEWPAVYAGTFSDDFLQVPPECLILSMQQHQKYVPLRDRSAKRLLPRFLFVSNLETKNPSEIIHGNERVLRARLADAKFFFDQDRKERLEARVPRLTKVVYHNKLGSQLERAERIQLLAGRIARDLKADASLAERAAWLAKADLLTGMVGEFPELQGVTGRYYALGDGEPKEVADAIEQHYRPRFAGDSLPQGPVACSVALADKLDTLAGLFGIGQQPTGEKDPFGLRRAALGVIRIVVEHQLPLSLHNLVTAAFAGYGGRIDDAHSDLQIFVLERFSGYLKDLGYSTLQVEAVLGKGFDQLSHVPRQLEAVKAFQALPEAESLAAANKRVVNILKQAATKGESFRNADRNTLKEPAEITLLDALNIASSKANALFEGGDYSGYLKTFAVLKTPVDAFFDSVMVMVEDEALRKNRLALLTDLREAMNRVADISKLAT